MGWMGSSIQTTMVCGKKSSTKHSSKRCRWNLVLWCDCSWSVARISREESARWSLLRGTCAVDWLVVGREGAFASIEKEQCLLLGIRSCTSGWAPLATRPCRRWRRARAEFCAEIADHSQGVDTHFNNGQLSTSYKCQLCDNVIVFPKLSDLNKCYPAA